MAARRMISTRFFKDPDIMSLSSKDTQLILIGLVLTADDEGREVAHAGLLGREMDYSAEQMEAALQELAANDLLVLYQVGKHRYYQLARAIRGWQTLGGRSTPSRYPAPSDTEVTETNAPLAGKSRGKVGEKASSFPEQEKLTEDKLTEGEEKATLPQGQAEEHARKVLPFLCPPSPTSSDIDAEQRDILAQSTTDARDLTRHIASILKLPVTEALTRLVEEYASSASLSLSGEADAAREWIDDPRRNTKGKRMSPAFFRNWLKRTQEALDSRQLRLQQTVPTAGTKRTPSVPGDPLPAGHRPPNLMYLADEDQRTAQKKGNAC